MMRSTALTNILLALALVHGAWATSDAGDLEARVESLIRNASLGSTEVGVSIRDLDTGFGFCGPLNWDLNGQLAYPVLLEGRPGELHITYSWGGRQAIRYLCIDEHEIMGVLHD